MSQMMLIDKIGEPALLELLAEECSELAHAALKMARAERGENPTPKTVDECKAEVMEECADVWICIFELEKGLFTAEEVKDVTEIILGKYKRMRERMKDEIS